MKRGKSRKSRATFCYAHARSKIRYRDLKDAKLARSGVGSMALVFRIYRCRSCGGYHLTTSHNRYARSTKWRLPKHEDCVQVDFVAGAGRPSWVRQESANTAITA